MDELALKAKQLRVSYIDKINQTSDVTEEDNKNYIRSAVFELIVVHLWDDLDVIEKINDLTYSRKVQLKSKIKK